MKDSVSIVIPNWNGRDLLKKNLPHVITAGEAIADSLKEIIVVDDGSTDDSLSLIKKFFLLSLFMHLEKILAFIVQPMQDSKLPQETL